MKKFNLSDIINEISIIAFLVSVIAAIATFGFSTPWFIASLILSFVSAGGVAATAIYNKNEIKKKNKLIEAKNQEEDQKMVESIEKLKSTENKNITAEENVVVTNQTKKTNKKIK